MCLTYLVLTSAKFPEVCQQSGKRRHYSMFGSSWSQAGIVFLLGRVFRFGNRLTPRSGGSTEVANANVGFYRKLRSESHV